MFYADLDFFFFCSDDRYGSGCKGNELATAYFMADLDVNLDVGVDLLVVGTSIGEEALGVDKGSDKVGGLAVVAAKATSGACEVGCLNTLGRVQVQPVLGN